MSDWWDSHGPPVYVAVAAYMGLIKKKPKIGNLEDLVSEAGPDGIIRMN